MKTFVFGDCHGCGEELEQLLDQMSPSSSDRVISVGDAFDRGIHAPKVWDMLLKHRIQTFMGNHEYKTLQWLLGRRDWLPKQYYFALNLLMEHGVKPQELLEWHEKLPLIRRYFYKSAISVSVPFAKIPAPKSFIVVHAAIDVTDPIRQNISWNIYGNMLEPMPKPQDGDGKVYFWDAYDGDELVIYGHLVTGDNLPRLRRNLAGKVNSIGLDTAAVHGGNLTGYCVEDEKFYSVACKDWGKECKERMKVEPPIVNGELMSFVNGMRESRRALLGEMAANDGRV